MDVSSTMDKDNGLEEAWKEKMEGGKTNGSPPTSPEKENANGSSPGSPQRGAVGPAVVSEQRGRFPTTVNFRQDSDKTKVYLIMSFRGLQTSSGLFGKGRKLENGEILNMSDVFQPSEVHLKVRVDNEDNTTGSTLFEYKKPLPKKIIPAKSKIEVEANGKIKLTLRKTKGDISDWTIYNEDFSHPNGS